MLYNANPFISVLIITDGENVVGAKNYCWLSFKSGCYLQIIGIYM